jgi:hypothetical protein
MRKKLLCVGDSHLSATRHVLNNFASAQNLDPVFIVVNWVDSNLLLEQFKSLAEGESVEIGVNHPSRPYSVNIEKQEIYAIVSSGFPYSGPGALFRKIANRSFTGSYNRVPAPQDVGCPWCYKSSVKLENDEDLAGMLSAACLTEIFIGYLTQLMNAPESAALLVLANEIGRYAHIPTPPMPSRTVIQRFGDHVFRSNLGNVMVSVWNAWAVNKSKETSRFFTVPFELVEDGWLIPEAKADGHPDFEIHANSKYGDAFYPRLNEWLQSSI